MITRLLDFTNRKGKSLAVRRRGGVHPKHLAPVEGHDWYLRHLRGDDHVLDFGCGLGFHALRAASVARSVWGVDRERRWSMVAPNLRFGQCDNLGAFVEHEFSAVMLLDVLEHIADRQRLLREIHRVLTPYGRLILSVPKRDTTWRERLRRAGLFDYSDEDHKTEYDWAQLAHELRASGFAPQPVHPTPGLWAPIVYDTPFAGLIDLVGGFNLRLYGRLMRWKRRMALEHPEESTGFRVVARKV